MALGLRAKLIRGRAPAPGRRRRRRGAGRLRRARRSPGSSAPSPCTRPAPPTARRRAALADPAQPQRTAAALGPVLNALDRVDPAPSIARPGDAGRAARPRRSPPTPTCSPPALGRPRARHRLRAGRRGLGLGRRRRARRHQRPRRRRRGRHHGDDPGRRLARRDAGLLRPRPTTSRCCASTPRSRRSRSPRRASAASGGAVLGYPENGPYAPAPARFGETRDVVSEDSYGRGPIQRARSASLRGAVRSGNSGGPLVDAAGRVLGTVFATTTYGTPGGFAIPDERRRSGPRRGPDAGRHGYLHRLSARPLHFSAVKSLPPEVERRRRLVTRTLPLASIAVVAFVVGAVCRRPRLAREGRRQALRRGLGERRLRRDVRGAEPGLAGGDRAQRLRRRLPRSRGDRDAALARSRARPATPTSSDGETVVPVAIDGRRPSPSAASKTSSSCPTPTAASPGTRASSSPACAAASTSKARSNWRRGRRSSPPTARRWPKARPTHANTRSAAPRSTSPAKSATAEEEDLPALARHGFAADTPVGISGLEQAFNARLAGKPGGSLLAVAEAGGSAARSSPRPKPKPGAPVKTTIDPGPAGSRGRRPRRARRRHRRPRRPQRRRPRPRRPGLLRPPAPGLDLQDDHHHRRPAEGRRLARRRIRNHQRRQRRRPLHRTTPTASTAAAPSARPSPSPATPTSPRSARRSATTTWSAPPKRFGFNSPPTLYAPRIVREVDPAESTIPTEIGEELDLGVSRDRPGRSAGDAAGDGERRADDRQRRRPRADLDRRQQEAAARRQAGAGDVEEDRRRTDRTDDRRRHRRHRHRRGDPRGPGRRQDRHRRARARSRARRTRKTRSRSRTPGSPPSPRPTRRSWRSGCC